MTPFETQSADGTVLRGTCFEAPDNPVAIMSLVHGFGEHCNRYEPMAAFLRTQNIATIAIDIRGHGRSDGKRGACSDYEQFRQDVDALIAFSRDTYPDLPHILFGHSMGGGLVLNYGLNRKPANITGIIAQAPLLLLPEPPPAFVEKIVKTLAKIAPNLPLGNKLEAHKISSLAEEQNKYVQDPLNHGRLTAGLAVEMIEAGRWTLSHGGQWTTPLLLMHAKADQLTAFAGSDAFADLAANCHFVPYDDVEHEIHNDMSRAAVYEEIKTFIIGLTGA